MGLKLSQGSLHLVITQKSVTFQFYLLRAAPLEIICLRAAASGADEANVVTPVDGEQVWLFPRETAASTGQRC